MTPPQTITSEIQKLEPSAIIELFVMDASSFGAGVLRFHAGTNGLRSNIVWQGNTYTAFPIQASGFDYSGNGQLPRPKLQVANITGAISLMVLAYDDLLGAKITRKRTLAKYLDVVNFPDTRKNRLFQTAALTTSPWGPYVTGTAAGTRQIITDSVYGPTLRLTKTGGANGDRFGVVQGFSGLTGSNHTSSIFINPRVAGSTGFAPYVDAHKSPSGLSTASAQLMGSDPLNQWTQKVAASPTQPLLGGGTFYIWIDGPVGSTVDFAFPQVESGSSATAYQAVSNTWSENPTADDTAEFADDIFLIDRKSTETRDIVEFELAAAFDVAGVQLPRRQIIQNVCTWRYRGVECGYTGAACFNVNDISVSVPAQDVCGKRLSSCKVRFGATSQLPFGSFPAAGLTR